MAFAFDLYTAGAAQTDYTITYAYRAEVDVLVYEDGVLQTQGANSDYIFFNATTIRFNAAHSGGELIKLQRASSQSTRIVDYTAGALTEADMDNDSLQAFRMSQESIDIANRALGRSADGSKFDAETLILENVVDPVADQDAATKKFVVDNTAADVAATAADVVSTNADVVLTGIDVGLTNADVVSTNADVVLTNADVVLTGIDLGLTNADVVLTGIDLGLTNADVVLTGIDVGLTNADVVLTNADVVLTGIDLGLTNTDVGLTNADVTSTNADVVSTNADVVLTGVDVGLTNADVVTTGNDVTAAAASAAAALASEQTHALAFSFATSTVMGDPGAGTIRFNNATMASVTAMAVDATTSDSGNPDVSDFIASWDDVTNAVASTILTIRESGDSSKFSTWNVTAVTDNTGWLQLTVSLIASDGVLPAVSDKLLLGAALSGADGAGSLSNLVEDVTPQLGAALDTNAFSIVGSEGAPVASAASPDIWAGDGDTIHITGTDAITGFEAAPKIGAWVKIIFDGVLTFTDGANLNLPGGANITTAADDFAFVYAETATLFKVLYFKVDGTAVVAAGGASVTQTNFVGNGTFTKITASTHVLVYCIGGGGGGGGGEGRNGGENRAGGGGGSGGALAGVLFDAGVVGATESVVVGAAGASGAGGSTANGVAGGQGGDTTFGTLLTGAGGDGGNGGASTGGTGGVGRESRGTIGGRGADGGKGEVDTVGLTGQSSVTGPGGGGGGGGLDAANTEISGRVGGDTNSVDNGGGGAAGAPTAGAGTAGGATQNDENKAGQGGGGGAGGHNVTGGAGGAGGAAGGGGGGGGGGKPGGASGGGGIGQCICLEW